MSSLFDVTVGGSGFHVTSHLISLVALFIACFAIAGYVSYRDNSIPGKALKDHDVDLEDIDSKTVRTGTLTVTGSGSVAGDLEVTGRLSHRDQAKDFPTMLTTGALRPADSNTKSTPSSLSLAESRQVVQTLPRFALTNYSSVTDTTTSDSFLADLFERESVTLTKVLDAAANVDLSADTLTEGFNFYGFKVSSTRDNDDTLITLPEAKSGKHIVITGFDHLTVTKSSNATARQLQIKHGRAFDDNSREIDLQTDYSVTSKQGTDDNTFVIQGANTDGTNVDVSQGMLVLMANSQSSCTYCVHYISRTQGYATFATVV